MAPLAFSLTYTSPETVTALEAGQATVHVQASVDIWALGVIAFELLSGERAFPQPVFPSEETKQAIQDAIAGRSPLPWEGESVDATERLAKLRGMRRSVLACLNRDPEQRPDAAHLLHTWDHAFDLMRSQTATDSGTL